jgi:hypothetical protein
MNPIRTLLTALLLVSFEANAATPLVDKVDWPAFMARHDLVFETLPTQFDYGAFLGNGLLGRSSPSTSMQLGPDIVDEQSCLFVRFVVGHIRGILRVSTSMSFSCGVVFVPIPNVEIKRP